VCVPLELAPGLLLQAARHLRARVEVGGEDGLGLGVALAQDAKAGLVVCIRGRGGLVLHDAVLGALKVVHDFGDPHRPGVVDCRRLAGGRRAVGWARGRLTSVRHYCWRFGMVKTEVETTVCGGAIARNGRTKERGVNKRVSTRGYQ
jgi:hypothetical protein